jgi:cellulose synthase/poly-beta-1,6-N-acetylglucosamine synthase-like glycosyltransferase
MFLYSTSVFMVISFLVSTFIVHAVAVLIKLSHHGLIKDYDRQPTVSILLPCYNEGKTVYDTVESISKSNYPSEKFEIIACDDCSNDDSYDWLLQAQRDFTNIPISVAKNDQNSGKAHTVYAALKSSKAEIILSIDSDCIFHPDAIRELVACFADPKIGAVGGAVGVRNVNENLLTKGQTFVYYVSFHLIKMLETWSKSVTCISGCMFAIRRELMVSLDAAVMERSFLGIPVNDGEDRFLTHMVLLAGYGTIINTAAQCLTTVPNNFAILFKQQIRWQRSGVRDLIVTLKNLRTHLTKVHPMALYSQLLPTCAALAGVLLMILLLNTGIVSLAVAPIFFIFYGALAAVFHIIVCKCNPEQKINNPLCLLLFPVWIIAGRLIQILAIFTLDSRDWGTRVLVPEPEPAPVIAPPLRQPVFSGAMATSMDVSN